MFRWQRPQGGGNLNAFLQFPSWPAVPGRSDEAQLSSSHQPFHPSAPSQSLLSTDFHPPYLPPRQPGLQEALAIPAQAPYSGVEQQVPGAQSYAAPNRAATRRRRKDQPSESEWRRHKPFLKKVYMDDDKTLDEVMAIMEQKSFHAS